MEAVQGFPLTVGEDNATSLHEARKLVSNTLHPSGPTICSRETHFGDSITTTSELAKRFEVGPLYAVIVEACYGVCPSVGQHGGRFLPSENSRMV